MRRLNNFAFLLLALLILLFPLGVIFRLNIYQNVYLYPQDLIASILASVLLFYYVKNKDKRLKRLFTSILAFNSIALISLFFNLRYLNFENFLISVSYLIRLDVYFSLLFVSLLKLSVLQNGILKKFFIFSSFLFVMFGMIQYLFYNNLRNLYYLGWDEHLYRLFSTFLDPNFTGLFIALFIIFLVGNILTESTYRVMVVIKVLASIFVFSALMLTHSRTALLGLTSGIIYLFISLKRVKLLIFSLAIIIFGTILYSNSSIEGLNIFRTASSFARVESMKEAGKIFIDNPVIGSGFNAYRYTQIRYNFRTITGTQNSNADAGTDNSFVFVLATTGIVGIIIYANIWLQIVRLIYLANTNIVRYTSIALLIILFIGSQFINALFYIPILSWIFIYLSLYALRKN